MNKHSAAYIVFAGTICQWLAMLAAWWIWGSGAAMVVLMAAISARLVATATPIMRGQS